MGLMRRLMAPITAALRCMGIGVMMGGCISQTVIPGVVKPRPGESLERIPGPMPGFGPFLNASDALIAACPLILGKPHATAGLPGDINFPLRWRISNEYCAWLYYTPDDRYEMSMLATAAVQDNPGMKRCDLPAWVEDQRYQSEALGYVFLLHNHPYASELSDRDLRGVVRMARVHGSWVVKARDREVPIAIIAFFSNSVTEPVECSGYFQYIPVTGEIIKWTRTQGGSFAEKNIASVTWIDSDNYRIERR